MASDDAKQYPTIEDFLMARYEEEERWLRSPDFNALMQIWAHRSIVEWHSRWPVMVQGPMETRVADDYFDMNTVRLEMSQRVDFMTHELYRSRFGEEPPSAPILKILAAVYSTHPDYNPDWSL